MTIGSLLLQPQPVRRFGQFSYEQALGDDAVALMQKIAMNPDYLEHLTRQVEAHLQGFIGDLQAHVEARMGASQAAMQNMLDPLIRGLEDLFDDDLDVQTVEDVIQVVLQIADKLAGFVESISMDRIRAWVEDLLNILFETFGFSVEFLQQLFCRFVDVVIQAMEDIPEDASDEIVELQAQVAALARRMKRQILASIPALNFNAESIARMLMAKLREFGLDKIQEKAQCLAEKARTLVGAGTGIYELAKAAEGGGSVGALQRVPAIRTGSQYCWYASWLYQNRRRTRAWKFFGTYLLPMVPKDEVWISEDRTRLILRHATSGATEDEILYESSNGSPINWYDAPQFAQTSGQDEHFTFTGALSANFMEQWTRAMSIVVIMSRMTGHVIHAAEPGNHVTHSILSVWHATRFVAEAVTGAPFTSWIRDRWNLNTDHRAWIDILFGWGPIFGGSFEGFNTNSSGGFQHWMTLIGDDAHDSFLINLWPTMVHEGFLSIFTLINQRGAAYTDFNDSGKPKNFEYSFPLTNVWLVFYSWLQSRVALGRMNYSHPFENTHMGPFLLNQLLWSWMFGALAGITGELCGWALSRSVSPRRLLIQLGWGAWKGFGTYIVCSYFWNEGDTDGGRYNPANAFTLDPNFSGYGDPDTSPYRLPIAAGRPVFVGQANQGMFSHFVDGTGTTQIYAADFAHAFQEMVVAVRDGVVVDYFDWITDDIQPNNDEQIAAGLRAVNSGLLVSNANGSQSGFNFNPASPNANQVPSWNFILVQHSDPNGTETADEQAHDLDQGGANVTTYAVYGHGANGGVRAAFASRGVAAADIIGSTVNRGDAIMQAGDTGVSFHNHLHLHVRPGPDRVAPASRPDPAAPEVITSSAMFGNRTLPIVFRDARHPLKSDGRLWHLTWYRSENG